MPVRPRFPTTRFYLLERIGGADWDEFEGFVVRAENEAHARQIANKFNHEHDREMGGPSNSWLDAKKTTCVVIEPDDGKVGVIFASFNAS